MRPVQSYPIWIGNVADGRDFAQIHSQGIRAVVQLALEEAALQPPREITLMRFPLLDSGDNSRDLLELAVSSAAHLVECSTPTLIVCSAGMSRSLCVAAAALAVVEKRSPDECLKEVVQHHPHDVSRALWKTIVEIVPNVEARFRNA